MAGTVHICHVLATLGGGGLENGVVNIVNGLDQERFRSTVVCVEDSGLMAERIVNPTARIVVLNQPDRLSPELPLRLARLFKTIDPDIVHTRNYMPNLYGTLGAHLARVPVIVNGEHGLIQTVGWRRKLVSRAVAPLADCVLCVSPNLRDYLEGPMRYPKYFVNMIINGVNLERFSANGDEDGKLRRELGIPEDVWLLGTVGRFHTFKDHPAFLDLLERLPEVDGRPVHVCIVGSGDYEADFRAEMTTRGLGDRVHLPGFTQDVHRYYALFDLFCLLSSGNEGTSNVLLEAMASGLPLVGTDITGNHHVIRNGWNGVLVPPRGEAKLQALMEVVPRLLGDPEERRRMGERGLTHVRESFSFQAMLRNYATFYARLGN